MEWCTIVLICNEIHNGADKISIMLTYTDLDAWKVGLDLVEEIYALTKRLPPSERFEMSVQMRKAVTSILANIAEGFGRYTYADKANKYVISRGECSEVEAFLHIAVRVKFLELSEVEKAFQLAEREKKLLSGLIAASRRNK